MGEPTSPVDYDDGFSARADSIEGGASDIIRNKPGGWALGR